MFRKILQPFKPRYTKLISSSERKTHHISPSSNSPSWCIKPHKYRYPSFKLASSVFNYIFNNLNLNHSYSANPNEIETLSEFIISQHDEEFEDEHVEELNKILAFLLSKGCTSKEIQEKCLPYLNSSNCSYHKFKELSDISSDIILLLPLLSLPLTTLKLAAKQGRLDKSLIKDFIDRISYLSHNLELEASELIPILTKHTALMTMKFKRLDYKMKILKNANISSKYIVKDLWIFNYNEKLLASRIQAALKADMELKPWMLRCSEKFFESMLIKNSETQRILDGQNVVNYLARKLVCNTEYVEFMMERNKLLKTINIPKLEQVLNFLFSKGYTPQEVRLFPRVFCSSVQTLDKRFEEYRRVKSTLPTISQLCISSKNFETTLKRKK